MEFQVKKTHELTEDEMREVCALFQDVFSQNKSLEWFRRQFLGTSFGYSYHGLMRDEGRIMGCYTSIPCRYRYFGRDMVFALSVDTMIHPRHQGNPFNLKRMAEAVYTALKNDGIAFVFGQPNQAIHLVRQRVLKWVDIGLLDYYILPIRPGGFKAVLKPADPFARLAAALTVRIPFGGENDGKPAERSCGIEKRADEDFLRYRYDQRHTVISGDAGYFAYRKKSTGGAQIGYLIDVFPLTRTRLERAVRHVYDHEKDLDAILYVGRLDFKPRNLLRLPKRYEPKPLPVAGRILLKGAVDGTIYDPSHWNLNLSNLDFY